MPLLIALVAARVGDANGAWLAGGCAIATVLAIAGALVLLPSTRNKVAMALLTVAGVFPVLCASVALPPTVAALMAAGLAAALLAVALVGDRVPGVSTTVRRIWSATSAVSALIAVTVAFDGEVAAPVLLAMAVVIAVAGRRDAVARAWPVGFGVIGGLSTSATRHPTSLVRATLLSTPDAVAMLASSILLIAAVVAIVWSWIGRAVLDTDAVRVLLAGLAVVVVYSVTTFTVTAGVLAGGESGGFFAGHMAATICWIAMAAALFVYAARQARDDRSLPIAGGLALVAGSMAKLFLFDLGTLDGMFRVAVFIVVGLVLLGMGAGYARLLAQQDQQECDATHTLIWSHSRLVTLDCAWAHVEPKQIFATSTRPPSSAAICNASWWTSSNFTFRASRRTGMSSAPTSATFTYSSTNSWTSRARPATRSPSGCVRSTSSPTAAPTPWRRARHFRSSRPTSTAPPRSST